jgi:hypothetical protein
VAALPATRATATGTTNRGDDLKLRVAKFDSRAKAVVVSRRPLFFRGGASRKLDRPAFVRAGSNLTWIAGRLAMVLDDTNFVALVDPASGLADAIPLPRGEAGVRQFDDIRGNKKYKLDLEACCALETRDGLRLIAFGSGSKRRRTRIVSIDRWERESPRVRLVAARRLYESLSRTPDFAGSDMNIEGALAFPTVIRLFGRGNGRRRGELVPVNATCELSRRSLLSFVDSPGSPSPRPRAVVQFTLGEIDGFPLGFTDATHYRGRVLYTAAAEASKDATEDGEVSGSVIGVLPARGAPRHALLRSARGKPLREKVEGIAAVPGVRDRVYVVMDPDDPTRPSELCEVRLSGL